MRFKNVLAVVTSQSEDEHVVAFADQLRKQISARLTMFVVKWKPRLVLTDAEDQLKVGVAKVKTRLDRETDATVLESQLIEIEVARSAIGMRARHFDVTIVGRPATAGSDWAHALLEGALFESGRPVIIVPAGWKSQEIGRRVLVCWKPTREAARALGDAEDLLSSAHRVMVVTAEALPSRSAEKAERNSDIVAHLARKGIKANLLNVDSADRNETDAILDQAQAVGADLIVMGGYGRSRLSEFIFGGLTSGMLQRSNIPVFMVH